MNTQIKQIAERLHGLRDSLDLTTAQSAEKCGVTEAEFRLYESGENDIPLSFICQVAQAFGVATTTLLSGDEPHAKAFFVTRKGTGASVERRKAYKYQTLASGFLHAGMQPFEVTVKPDDLPVSLNTHQGQEFNYVLEGTLLLHIAGSELTLHEGDSIYFDATMPHGMKAMGNKKVKFLAIIG